ncbi:ABC transporter related protein [Denitrovibrio acetiphilus DSM 12809]|uniref:ABC transporter related protein n=1 Tax=Denitrovibrio acetiphilus (strain DSM 12809 / NBRC 114555 / N2460) TaxID=522772 RepID=D4H2S1_DENA2|nr:ABC transporter ATP-binding protein [Denitrovibrio acetiphilus]ADD67132.1 ABC transporter related protein [Denitrovibrio acetiphilus DSM 12809]
MSEPLIKFSSVNKKYGHIHALRDVSVSFEKGEFVSVFGPNGAGKSTFLKLLCTMTSPSSGEISYEGVPLKKLRDEYRSRFGVISHQPFLYSELTAMENLRFYAQLYGVKHIDERIKELLTKVELYKRRNDKVRGYSRGMLQRLSITRALLHNPDIVVLDEPYTGLDTHASDILTKILTELFDSLRTIIMVTHNMKQGYDAASRLAIIRRGKLVFDKKKSDISLTEFERSYTEAVS